MLRDEIKEKQLSAIRPTKHKSMLEETAIYKIHHKMTVFDHLAELGRLFLAKGFF